MLGSGAGCIIGSVMLQANGAASLKEQAKAAASHPAKPALKASAAGEAAPSISAAIAQNVSELEGSANEGQTLVPGLSPHKISGR